MGIKTIFRPQKLHRAGTAPPILKFLDPPLYLMGMLAYLCHDLSESYVDLSDIYVDLSIIYVDLSEYYVDLTEKNIISTSS